MTLWRLPQWPWRNARASAAALSERMLSMGRFHAALERERMRADRCGSQFSVVEFSWPGIDCRLCDQIVTRLEERLRATDELGELPNGIGVLLPMTAANGAQQLAEYVVEGLPEHRPLTLTIREYPANNVEPSRTASFTATETTAQLAPTNALFIKPLPLWKRAIDIVASGLGLLCVSPLLLMAASAIKLTSPGPVLFLQRRTGLGGKPFTIYKLRTMTADAESRKQELRPMSEQDGPAFKMKNDPRITTVGKYLRKTCIDELPQLWNVLVGDMTLVGPRPLPCDEANACEGWERRRLDVTPGLTCIWQVRSGRSRISFSEWMRMDLRYIRRRSLIQDVKLLWKTFVAVILHRASQ